MLVALGMQPGKGGADYLLHCLHKPLKNLPIRYVAVPVLHSDASGQAMFCGAPVEGCEDRCWEVSLLHLSEEVQMLVMVDRKRLSVMRIPRNFSSSAYPNTIDTG